MFCLPQKAINSPTRFSAPWVIWLNLWFIWEKVQKRVVTCFAIPSPHAKSKFITFAWSDKSGCDNLWPPCTVIDRICCWNKKKPPSAKGQARLCLQLQFESQWTLAKSFFILVHFRCTWDAAQRWCLCGPWPLGWKVSQSVRSRCESAKHNGSLVSPFSIIRIVVIVAKQNTILCCLLF